MLTKEDLNQIGGLMDEKFVGFEQKIDKKMDEKFVGFEKKIDERFVGFEKKIDEKFVKFEERIVDRIVVDVGEMFEQNFLPAVDVLMEDKLAPIKVDIVGIKGDIVGIKSSMVTKDYLDQKLGTVNGKLVILTDVLYRNGTISDDQRRSVYA